MSVLSDKEIHQRCINDNMISPYVANQVSSDERGRKILSYGVSSYGYDVRCARDFKIFTDINTGIIDPKSFDEKNMVEYKDVDSILIPPHSFVLTSTVEYLKVPRDIIVVCLGKSTLARCGLVVGITPLEPEWEGHITIELSNTTSLPMRVYANEGIAQLVFHLGNTECLSSYKDRKGKYMGQKGIVTPRV